MVVSEVNNHWNQHWESFVLVGLQNVEEIIVLKEAHSSVSHLEMDTTNTSYNSLEKFRNEMFDFVNFANFQDFLKFSKEESFLDAVSKWPILQQPIEESYSKGSVLGEEEH